MTETFENILSGIKQWVNDKIEKLSFVISLHINNLHNDISNLSTNKQDKLTAGSHISISNNNVISVVGNFDAIEYIEDLNSYDPSDYVGKFVRLETDESVYMSSYSIEDDEWKWQLISPMATNDDIDEMFIPEPEPLPEPDPSVRRRILVESYVEDGTYDGMIHNYGETMIYNHRRYYKWVKTDNLWEYNESEDYYEGDYNIILLTTSLTPELPFDDGSEDFAYAILYDEETGNEADYEWSVPEYNRLVLVDENGDEIDSYES